VQFLCFIDRGTTCDFILNVINLYFTATAKEIQKSGTSHLASRFAMSGVSSVISGVT
jgi:hypothetical protein